MASPPAEQARKPKDKSVQIHLILLSEFRGLGVEIFRSFSSFPRETNCERIPGLEAVEYNSDLFSGANLDSDEIAWLASQGLNLGMRGCGRGLDSNVRKR